MPRASFLIIIYILRSRNVYQEDKVLVHLLFDILIIKEVAFVTVCEAWDMAKKRIKKQQKRVLFMVAKSFKT